MLKSLTIKKFRSIENDTIVFNSPLTVLIGANGTGKTNLLLALRFISESVKLTPRRATQMLGGLDSVFTIRATREKECSFSMNFELTEVEGTRNDSETWTADYGFTLYFDDLKGTLYVKKESFRVTNQNGATYDIFQREGSYNDSKTLQQQVELVDQNILNKFFNNPQELLLPKFIRGLPIRTGSNAVLSNIAFEVAERCVRTLRGITGFNFDPSSLRKSSDILATDAIGYDGKGFSAFLNATINIRKHMKSVSTSKLYGEDFIAKLKLIFEDTLPFLSEFDTEEDMETTAINLRFREVQQSPKDRSFRSQHLSDGSLKFLATASMIIHGGFSIFFIEELENYLNPRAIIRLLELMRDISLTSNKIFIVSTHSETVLNISQPEHLLISTRAQSGATTYRRLRDPANIKKALERGGFGMGYIWSSGGLDALED